MSFDISQLVIEKNIPLPPLRRDNKTNSIAGLLRSLDPGDSVLVPKKQSSVASCFHRIAGKKFSTRSEGNDKTRVWRVA